MSQNKRYPLSTHGINLFKVNATIGGVNKGDFHRVTLLVDTGASFTILPILVLEIWDTI